MERSAGTRAHPRHLTMTCTSFSDSASAAAALVARDARSLSMLFVCHAAWTTAASARSSASGSRPKKASTASA